MHFHCEKNQSAARPLLMMEYHQRPVMPGSVRWKTPMYYLLWVLLAGWNYSPEIQFLPFLLNTLHLRQEQKMAIAAGRKTETQKAVFSASYQPFMNKKMTGD